MKHIHELYIIFIYLKPAVDSCKCSSIYTVLGLLRLPSFVTS